MDEIASIQETITVYLRQMKFKKRTIGGVEEEDVLDKIDHITTMYRDLSERLRNQNSSLQQETRSLRSQVEELRKSELEKNARLSSLQAERSSMQLEYQASLEKIKTLQQPEKDGAEFILRVQREAQKILTQAKLQAENLDAQKAREIDHNQAARRLEINRLSRQREALDYKMTEFTLQTKTALQMISSDLHQVLNLSKELDGKIKSLPEL
jgi:DNA repair exonuclease SbcCD ATPase subunit